MTDLLIDSVIDWLARKINILLLVAIFVGGSFVVNKESVLDVISAGSVTISILGIYLVWIDKRDKAWFLFYMALALYVYMIMIGLYWHL
jgi:hypothetical protein